MSENRSETHVIEKLLAVMARLRDPKGGCPWDLAQDFTTIAPYTIEEACEVADAIARNDMLDLKDELGDLLLQVVFHARMAQEQGLFDFGAVVEAITAKMIRRHPHVFGNAGTKTQDEVNITWAQIKAQEKAERAAARAEAGMPPDADSGVLADVPAALPALARAVKLQSKASTVGFDWNDPLQVLAKIREECDELEAEIRQDNKAAINEEVGDLLFAVANLARHAKVDAEAALRGTNEKFRRRFGYIEDRLAATGRAPEDVTLADMDRLWDEAKRLETGKAPAKLLR